MTRPGASYIWALVIGSMIEDARLCYFCSGSVRMLGKHGDGTRVDLRAHVFYICSTSFIGGMR
jgi:hypothetical protein